MRGAVLVAVALLLIVCSVAISLFGLVRSRIRRHHRVDPTVPSDAPLSWSFDPRAMARLHRRLTRVGAVTTGIIDERPTRRRLGRRRVEPGPIQRAALDLREQAVATDLRLSRLARLPPAARRTAVADLGHDVDELERASTDLVRLAARVDRPSTLAGEPDPVADATRHVDLLTSAHDELRRLDHDAGLEAEPTAPRHGGTGSLSPGRRSGTS